MARKLGGSFPPTAKFVIPGEGTIIADADGVRAGEDEAAVTMTASAEVFRGILEGSVNPTMAFMSGKLKIDGSMGLALQLAGKLS
ncbi:SCP2 sterol-binding domain-containing protein [Phaeovulum veldkampii]|uniref:Sterol carrier family protein n=1 Tax=Phaeovulum veldkampii DSM 11550 TaxID=1185920 RepID=A0A2T4JAK7_9RHOB|nr:SCP2 sterol-binding domain-containing protein [Phaeovulum veldkampii]PTE14932.1 sterol carrier family protein [Phaeovulum veldkampii DSM 11550]